MTNQKPTKTYNDEASLLLTSVTASPVPSFSFGQGVGVPATKKKKNVPTMRAMIVTTCFLLGTLAVIYGGSHSSRRSSGSSTPNSSTVAVVTSDESCATEVLGEGPCCDSHPVDTCSQVCDWLLRCDNGYVPELTNETATVFPETSHYQPHNCHCRGYATWCANFHREVRRENAIRVYHHHPLHRRPHTLCTIQVGITYPD